MPQSVRYTHLIAVVCAIVLTACRAGDHARVRTEQPSAEGDTVETLSASTMAVYHDLQNNYWFGSWDSGVYRYDGETLVNYSTAHGLPNNRIDEFHSDASGNVYFISCHPKLSVVKFDGKAFTTLNATPSEAWELNPNDLWFRHAYGEEKVLRYDGTTLHELSLPKAPGLTNPYEIYSIYRDREGNVWFGTNPVGVCRYNGTGFDWITEEDVTEFRNEGANGVRGILEDANGDFWFNTENRYSVYDSATLQSGRFYTRHPGIGGLDGKADSNLDEYLSCVRDANNHLWFVTYLDGVWKYDGTEITHYPVIHNGQQITLFSISIDREGVLWLGTHEHGAWRFNGSTFEQMFI